MISLSRMAGAGGMVFAYQSGQVFGAPMTYTLADLDSARRQAADSDTWVKAARMRIEELERQGRDAADARMLLKHLETARRSQVARLGEIRRAIGPAAY